ncbi:MAG TPA: FadR/GntR family transcriptional regulator [Aggregatilineales bacterium]|nr:FadR/GntR family transcriptional regulator [Aggregatilineales bacterium]
MEKPLQPIKLPPLINDQVQEALKQYILDNHLQNGDKLPSENALSRQLGVSRNSVREAVQSLASLGILEVRRGSGLYVKGFTLQPLIENLQYGFLFDLRELEDLLIVREVLENGMVELALRNLTPDCLEKLDALVEQMHYNARNGLPLVDPDRAFHIELFRPVGNAILLQLQDIFWSTLRKALNHTQIADSNPVRTAQSHAEIVAAVRSGDAAAVRRALSRHYEDIKLRLAHMKQRQSLSTEETH